MQSSCENIEKTCTFLESLLQAVDLFGVPPIPFVGLAGHRFYNPPAPHLEVCFLVEGACPDLRIGDQPHPLANGQLSLHTVHHGNYSTPHEMRAWCLFFAVDALNLRTDFEAAPLALTLAISDQEAMANAFHDLASLCYEAGRTVGYFDPEMLYEQQDTLGRPGLGYQIKGAVLGLLGRILSEAGPPDPQGSHLPAALRQTLGELCLRYQDASLGLPDLARSVGLSPNHLGRLFREHLGQPPMQYLQALRLEQARNLLRHTDLRVNEIAWQVGWRDPLYFSRLFKRETGCSPSTFRRRHR